MNDIILIDDNSKGQRAAYGASFVDEDKYAGILHHVERLNMDSDLAFLSGAKCVLVHYSLEDWIDGKFDEYSHIAKENINDYIEEHQIPFVYFSDGDQSTGKFDDNHLNILQLKKSDFYNRLDSFIEYYISEGKIQFNILAFGKNYLKELLTIPARAILGKLQTKRPTDRLYASDVMPVKSDEPHYLEDFVNLSQPAISLSYDDLLNRIDDEVITVKDFRERINNILKNVAQNGKNTYTWE